MMLVDNRKIIRDINKPLYDLLLELENTQESSVIVEPAKKEGETIAVQIEGKKIYLTSKYNPIQEAQKFNAQLDNLTTAKHLLFVGVGMGYHIMEVLKSNPSATYSIYEPNINVLNVFLQKNDLSRLKPKLVEVFTHPSQITSLKDYIEKYLTVAVTVRWVTTNNIYKQSIAQFDEMVINYFKDEKYNKGVTAAHQQRWQTNAIINLPKILKTTHLFDLDNNIFANKPVMIVAAGPSLSFDIEIIKQIKNEKKAYIFAVGSAINALIENEIMPDVFVSFDPQVSNQNVMKKVKEKNLQIPMFFGSTIGHEALKDYPGPLVHFFVNQETISRYLLNIQPQYIFTDRASVTIMALEICTRFNMGPIILAGQNCGYLGNKRYADGVGTTHFSSEFIETEGKKYIEIESVDGDIIYSDSSYLAVKESLEFYIDLLNVTNLINTTKQGAIIEGAPYIPLEVLMQKELKANNVVNSELNLVPNQYDIKEVKANYAKLEQSFDELLPHIKQIDLHMAKVIERRNTKVYQNLQADLMKFDKEFLGIHRNLFFKVIIEPMIGVQKKNYNQYAPDMKKAIKDKDKVDIFIKVHVPYVRSIIANIIFVQTAFKELNQIKEWE